MKKFSTYLWNEQGEPKKPDLYWLSYLTFGSLKVKYNSSCVPSAGGICFMQIYFPIRPT